MQAAEADILIVGTDDDLLTLTQMDSTQTNLRLEAVDFSALCTDTVHALQPAANKAGLTLDADIPASILLTGDESKLSQAVYNLIDNAIKYTPAGGRVSVRLTAQQHEAVLTVQDNGIGIPQEDVKLIFDRFYRVDKARSRETGGTGLGLSIVHQIVKLHGGEIIVESQEGKGSQFTVELPVQQG